jgi:uncharacterized protein DUF3298
VKKLVLSVVLVLLLLGYEWVRTSRHESHGGAKPVAVATPLPMPSPSPGLPVQAERINKEWPSYFAVTERSITPVLLDYELSANYPELTSSRPDVRAFNRWIKNKVLGYANDFRRRADAEQQHKRRGTIPVYEGLDLDYVVYYSNERLVSIRLTHCVMSAGQMHPISYYETINYDLRKGKQLQAKDVFKRGYLKQWSTYSRKELSGRYALPTEDGMIDGTRPTIDNFSNWNIVPDGVLLSFEDYQVGPHSFGQPEFVVPFRALGDTMRHDALQKLLASNKRVK